MQKVLKMFSYALVVLLASVALVACVPANVEKAEAKMEEAGYTVVAYSKEDAEGLVGGFVASKGLTSMTAMLFDSTKNAEQFIEDALLNVYTQEGKWVLTGSEKAIEDFKA
ncbi:MAG: hypothetical protein IKB42_05150 [Clostridia bacterium]|nr:hypothetical protein [Clostridia bacterium]